MAQKSDFKTVETDLDELEEKIRKHRRKIAKRIIIVVAAVVALFLIVWLWMALRTYKSFDVKNSVEQKDKSAVSFVDFCGAVVEYSNDGVLYTDSDGNRIWNQAFEMSSPQVVTCESFMTIYDRGGTDLYIMEKNGVKKEIGTSWPIIKACIARLSPQEAFYSQKKSVRIMDAVGAVSGEFVMCYPPGIPILAPGELITKEIAQYIVYAKEKGCSMQGTEDPAVEYLKVLER